VVTATPIEQNWANSSVAEEDLPGFVTGLKQRSGGDIGVHGSVALTQSLLREGLVDELRLVIAPALQIHGRRLFDGGVPKRLSLTRNLTSPAGYILADFLVRN
jgi:dihydrofolate reductase